MARPRKIEPDRAVPAAMALFWRHGFHEVGTRQLESETGVTRFALQTIHGGKKALFVQALDAYLDRFDDWLVPQMRDGTLDTLAAWFLTLGSPAQAGANFGCGCLMVNSLVEFGGQDDEVNQRVERFLGLLRGGLTGALQDIAAQGGLAPGVDVARAVELLTAAAIGLNVSNRATRGAGVGGPMAQGIAATIRGWAAP